MTSRFARKPSNATRNAEFFPGASDFSINDGTFTIYNNVQPIPSSAISPPNLSLTTVVESEIYARHLLLRRKGYPLWRPDLDENLPPDYRSEGLRIGDLVVLNDVGGVDYLFNICLPAEHPFNVGRVPNGFSPLKSPLRIWESSDEHPPSTHITNSDAGIRRTQIVPAFPIPGVPPEFGSGLVFESIDMSSGALLILPEGGSRCDLRNLATFSNYVKSSALSWYRHVNGALGLEVDNGSLYLVTGCDKARCWGVASFTNAQPKNVRLEFVPTSPATSSTGVPRPRYRFQTFNSAMARSGADSLYGHRSGCVFLRGFKISVKTSIAKMFGISVSVLHTESAKSDNLVPNGKRAEKPFSPRDGKPQVSDNGGKPISRSMGITGELGSALEDDSCLEYFPAKHSIYHPSDIINQYILNTHDDATVSIVHDSEWGSVLKDSDVTLPESSELLARIQSKYAVEVVDGFAYLVLRTPPASQSMETLIMLHNDDATGREEQSGLMTPRIQPSFDASWIEALSKSPAGSTEISNSELSDLAEGVGENTSKESARITSSPVVQVTDFSVDQHDILLDPSSDAAPGQSRAAVDHTRWSGLHPGGTHSYSPPASDWSADVERPKLRHHPSFDMSWLTIHEQDEIDTGEEDSDEDLLTEANYDREEAEVERAATPVVAEEGRGLIVQADNAAVAQLNVQPGTTHLIIGSSSTPNAIPPFLTDTVPRICHSLLVLDISANFLAGLPPVLASCHCLEELNIASNPLRALPVFLADLTNLRILIADSTGITTLPDSLAVLHKLHTISVRRNKLHALPSWLCLLPSLQALYVNDNPFQGPWKSLVEPLLTRVPITHAYTLPTFAEPLFTSVQVSFDIGADSDDDLSDPPSGFATNEAKSMLSPKEDHSLALESAPSMRRMSSRSSYLVSQQTASTTSSGISNSIPLEFVPPLPPKTQRQSAESRPLTQSWIGPESSTSTNPPSNSPHPSNPEDLEVAPESEENREVYTRALRSVMAYLKDMNDLESSQSRITSTVSGTPGERSSRSPTSVPDPQLLKPREVSMALSGTTAVSSAADAGSIMSMTTIVGSLGSVEEKEIKDDKEKRMGVLREILLTERTYVKGLQELMDIYIKPACSEVTILSSFNKETVVPAPERKIVFGGLEALFFFHKESFLPSLEVAIAPLLMPTVEKEDADGDLSLVVTNSVANIFLKHAAFMKLYSAYVNNFDNALQRVKYWTSGSVGPSPPLSSSSTARLPHLWSSISPTSDPNTVGEPLSSSQRKRIKQYLKRCRLSPRHSQLNLESYLLLPVQRIPRYRVLLEELRRNTPLDYDYLEDTLDRALGEIETLANNMNEGKRESESRRKLVQWQSRIRGKFPSPLVQPHRRLIMDGPLSLTRVVRKVTLTFETVNVTGYPETVDVECLSPELTPRSLLGILCNDILVLCKDPSGGQDPASQIDVWAVLRMKTAPQPASIVDGNSLRVIDNRAILYFDLPSAFDALNWCRAINLYIPSSRT